MIEEIKKRYDELVKEEVELKEKLKHLKAMVKPYREILEREGVLKKETRKKRASSG